VFVLLDADLDGFEDLASFGDGGVLWRNEGGARLTPVPLDLPVLARRDLARPRNPSPSGEASPATLVGAATVLDADGDGRGDLVLLGRERILLRNVAERPGAALDVTLAGAEGSGGAPIGAVVRARYADGRIVARRHGSAANTALSQALQPLRFAHSSERPVVGLRVRWPGRTDDEPATPPDPGGVASLVLRPPR